LKTRSKSLRFLPGASPGVSLSRAALPLLLAVLLAACGTQRPAPVDDSSGPVRAAPAEAPQDAPSNVVKALQGEARTLMPLVSTKLAQDFLAASRGLPNIQPRTIYQDPATRGYYSKDQAERLSAEQLKALLPVQIDEYRYYHTKYGSPLAYVRAVELMGRTGIDSLEGRRILDFGYGTVAHLRLFALQGAHAVGVDVDSYLSALYSERADTGAVRRGRQAGTVALVHGRWPAEKDAVEKVGDGYDVIISKNTLKRGYIKPARPAEKRHLIDLGVNDDEFLKALAGALKPGGLLVIYNLAPAQAPANKPYIPWADARSPYTKAQYEKAGFKVLQFDVNDDAAAREMGRKLGWDRNSKNEVQADYEKNLFALYTIVQKEGQ
jgi:SAM-dependent methyltransferase